jgi:hypothetical protein
MRVGAAQADVPLAGPAPESIAVSAGSPQAKPVDLKAAAMGDAAVQAMLDVFPTEIEDVEEI